MAAGGAEAVYDRLFEVVRQQPDKGRLWIPADSIACFPIGRAG